MNHKLINRFLATVAVLLAASCLAMTSNLTKPETQVVPRSNVPNPTVNDHPVARDGKFGASFAPVIKKVAPSVVKVFTTTRPKPGNEGGFGEFPPFGGRIPYNHGLGSGVIVTRDGYILTNNHVVDGADEIKVSLQNDTEFSAKIVGKDPKTDIAVLKIEGKDLPFMEMADSDKIEVGDVVLAIGNPFGIGQTVTSGIISATGRATFGLDYEDFIQTDAAINPGNSGGALVDAEGRLIGINTAIISRSGGNQGIGFAIPTNLAREVMDSLIKYGKVTRGQLGIVIQDVTPALARAFRLKEQQGALVGDVKPESPAQKAGIVAGDVVIEFNGKPVRDSRHLKLEVGRTKPGSVVAVKLMRDGTSRELKVTLEEQPGMEQQAKADQTEDKGVLKDVAVANLDPEARRELNVPDQVQGALVTEVRPNSAASDAGLQSGDVIQEINHKPVRNADDAVRLTEMAKNKTTLLNVWSKGNSRYIVVEETNQG